MNVPISVKIASEGCEKRGFAPPEQAEIQEKFPGLNANFYSSSIFGAIMEYIKTNKSSRNLNCLGVFCNIIDILLKIFDKPDVLNNIKCKNEFMNFCIRNYNQLFDLSRSRKNIEIINEVDKKLSPFIGVGIFIDFIKKYFPKLYFEDSESLSNRMNIMANYIIYVFKKSDNFPEDAQMIWSDNAKSIVQLFVNGKKDDELIDLLKNVSSSVNDLAFAGVNNKTCILSSSEINYNLQLTYFAKINSLKKIIFDLISKYGQIDNWENMEIFVDCDDIEDFIEFFPVDWLEEGTEITFYNDNKSFVVKRS